MLKYKDHLFRPLDEAAFSSPAMSNIYYSGMNTLGNKIVHATNAINKIGMSDKDRESNSKVLKNLLSKQSTISSYKVMGGPTLKPKKNGFLSKLGSLFGKG